MTKWRNFHSTRQNVLPFTTIINTTPFATTIFRTLIKQQQHLVQISRNDLHTNHAINMRRSGTKLFMLLR